jgi:hypothetical protein
MYTAEVNPNAQSRSKIDLLDQRFGSLLVFGFAGMRWRRNNRQREGVWKCRCDCGNELMVTTGQLRYGHSSSCGCGRLRSSPQNKALTAVWHRYRHQAKQRGLKWELSKAEFLSLVHQRCYYCNRPPSNLNEFVGGKQLARAVYNGIDRVNSELGYNAENVVPSCFICNRAKGSMHVDQFLEWIHAVHRLCVKSLCKSCGGAS